MGLFKKSKLGNCLKNRQIQVPLLRTALVLVLFSLECLIQWPSSSNNKRFDVSHVTTNYSDWWDPSLQCAAKSEEQQQQNQWSQEHKNYHFVLNSISPSVTELWNDQLDLSQHSRHGKMSSPQSTSSAQHHHPHHHMVYRISALDKLIRFRYILYFVRILLLFIKHRQFMLRAGGC